MKLEEFNNKIAELKAEGLQLATDGKLDEAEAKKNEIEALEQAFQAEKEAAAEENALNKVNVVPEELQNSPVMGEENKKMEKIYAASSLEFKNAFLKHISGRDDEMTQLENDAFVHTTQNTPNVLPTEMVNEIWSLIESEHSIVGDVTTYRTGTILEVVKHTAVVKGAAAKQAKSAEGTAPADDEQNTLLKVTLSGNDFAKAVELSYAEAKMSLPALENYLIKEIADSLGDAIAADMVSTVQTGMAAGNKTTTAAAKTVTFKEIAGAFAALKRAKEPVVYATRATVYNYLATLEDSEGHLIFQASANEGVNGYLLGAQVKIEDAVGDNVILIGDPKRVVNNVIEDVMVETDKDIKAHKFIYSGYARCECALIDDQSFAQLTVKQS